MAAQDKDKDKDCLLTRGLLWAVDKSTGSHVIPVPIEISAFSKPEYKYVLGIYAPAAEFLKITTYFLDVPDVTKITFIFNNVDGDLLKKIYTAVSVMETSPIHVSGFCQSKRSGRSQTVYEMYVKGTRENVEPLIQRIQDLDISFDVSVHEMKLAPANKAPKVARK
jgi:hypothetical protein